MKTIFMLLVIVTGPHHPLSFRLNYYATKSECKVVAHNLQRDLKSAEFVCRKTKG